ncbi:hypothetical protein ABZ848_05475 [Streptomyces sp. NPDC047081]
MRFELVQTMAGRVDNRQHLRKGMKLMVETVDLLAEAAAVVDTPSLVTQR